MIELYENLNFVFEEIKLIDKNSFLEILPNEEIQNFVLIKEDDLKLNENTKRLDICFSVFVQNLDFFKAKKTIYEIYKKLKYRNSEDIIYKDETINLALMIAKFCPKNLYQVNRGSYQFVCTFDLSISLREENL